MRRYLNASSAAAALAMIAGSAFGGVGNVLPIQPVVSNAGDGGGGAYEVVGSGGDGDVSIIIELDDVATDDTPYLNNISTVFYNAAGAQVGLPLVIAIADISDALGNNDGNIDNNDLLTIDITSALQNRPAGAFSMDVVYADPGGDGDSLTMDNDGFPGLGDDSDDTDEFFRIIEDQPTISGAFIQEVDMADDKLFVTINFPPLGIGANSTVRSTLQFPNNGGEANPNNIGGVNTFDFEKDTGSGFEQFEAEDITAVAAIADGDIFLELDFDETMSDLASGDMIQLDATTGDVRDGTGNILGGVGTLAALPELAVESATWQMPLSAFDGAVAGALELDFNLDLDLTDLGTAAFYNSIEIEAAAAAGVTVTGVAAGSGNDRVLLTVNQASGTNIVTPAGVRDDNMSYAFNVDTDMTAGEPSDVFGNAMTADITNTIGDGISPILDISDLVYKDSDGDGVQDGVLFVFEEPLDSALTGSSADDLGITLTRNGGVTLNPIDMIDGVTGAMTSYDTVASADTADDDISVTDIEVVSYDADGDGTISDLETNNALCVSFDPTQDFEVSGGGWDNDDTTTAGTGDGPGTGDDGAVQGEIDADDSDIADANGVNIDSDEDTPDTDDIDEDSNEDGAAPVALNTSYRSGDNFSGGNLDTFVETDGNVGDDDDNNVFYGVFSEALDTFVARGADEDTSLVSWGPGAFERFAFNEPVRILGADDNILQIEDDDARGFAPGDTVTFSDGVGIGDTNDNQILGSFDAPDATPPFVALQTDINGNDVLSAFLFDTSDPADGFANEVRLFTGAPVDPATVLLGDFTYSGGTDFDAIDINASGQQITLTFPAGSNLPVSSNLTVTYAAPADNDDMDSQIIAGTDGNSVFPGLSSNITARPFPTPDVDTDDLAVMDLRGAITMGGSPIGVGAKVFGFVGVPVPKTISGTVGGLDFWLSDSNSLEAFWNFMFGFESHLYFFNDEGEIWFDNDFDDNSGSNYEQYDVSVNAANLNNVTFTARGRSYTSGDSVPRTNLTVTGGRVAMGWDVLRSSSGTIGSLKSSGFQVDGDAIASRAVVEGSDGTYAMHLSAPITQFYGTFGAAGWPVVVVVEEATGTRYPASSIHNATDNEGTLFFNPLQRDTDPNDDNDRNGGSNVIFDINLDNVGMEYLYQGWNLMPFNRISGYAKTTGNIPTLPAIQGSDNSNVAVSNTLPNSRAFNQFIFFHDDDSNGEWTANDDSDFFDSMYVDVNCFDNMRFVMTNRGVNVGDGVGGFIGGYGAGFYNGDWNMGVFQFGAAGSTSSATEIFTGTFSSSTTLGWALVTAPAADADPTTWLNTNDADFVIEFNRISNGEVDVNTQGNESDNINDVVEINEGQAYFVSFE